MPNDMPDWTTATTGALSPISDTFLYQALNQTTGLPGNGPGIGTYNVSLSVSNVVLSATARTAGTEGFVLVTLQDSPLSHTNDLWYMYVQPGAPATLVIPGPIDLIPICKSTGFPLGRAMQLVLTVNDIVGVGHYDLSLSGISQHA